MVDYYAILTRAMEASDANDPAWRRNLYDRARRTLANEMRARPSQTSRAEIAGELAALEAAIERIEAERIRNELADSDSTVSPPAPDQSRLLDALRSRRPVWFAFALIVA